MLRPLMHPELEPLVEAGRLHKPAAETLSQMEPGEYCYHRSWGPGKVAQWDLIGDRIIIDFKDKPGHPMKLEFAAKSLEPITEEHIYARVLINPAGVAEMAEKEPVALVRVILESFGRSLSLDRFDEVVTGNIVPAARFKPWWESTKRKLRQDRTFVVPAKRNLPLELRAEDLTPAQALLDDFEGTRDLKGKATALTAMLSDLEIYSDPATELADTMAAADDAISRGIRIQPGVAIELALARDDIQELVPALKSEGQASLAELIREAGAKLGDFLTRLPIAVQRRVLDAYPGAFGEEWVDRIIDLLPGSGLRGASEIARVLDENGEKGTLEAHLKRGIQERSLPSDLIAWICKERKGAASGVFSTDLAPAVLGAIEKDHYDEGPRRSNRLLDAITGDPELLPDLVRDGSLPNVKTFSRRLLATPAFDELTRRSLLARIIKVFPEIEQLASGDEGKRAAVAPGEEKLVVSWESLEERKRYLENLISVRIPANKKEIQVAREYGDLSENFEYKAAKQEQAKLTAERNLVEGEIKRARGTDFAEVDTSRVSIGTTVELEDVAGGGTETFTILGAWDTNLDRGIISYLSETAKALIGSSPGDVIAIPTEEEGVTRDVRIGNISAFNTGE